jgi:glucose/mannose-6-phosphate isomerase
MSEQIIVLDEQKMLEKINDLPNQLEKAWTSLWIKDLPLPREINKVLICGMGGSGIAGALAQDLFMSSHTPLLTWNDYGLPGWVDEQTLVINVSFSGETEETVDAVKKALDLKVPLVLISSGGKFQELATVHGLPLVTIDYAGSPRAAIGWLYGSLLTVLAKTQLFTFKEGDLFRSIEELRMAIAKKSLQPQAEELAMSLNNKLPLILAYAPLVSVARRFVTQLNENSKTTAFWAALPELCHNLIAGLDFAISEKISVLFLESEHGFGRNTARQKIIQQIFTEKQIVFTPMAVRSSSRLAEQLLLIHVGDLLSYYLAGVNGVDPTPIPEIATLKEALKKI